MKTVISEHEAMEIAATYGTELKLSEFVVDGCELEDEADTPSWRVFLSFTETEESLVGLPQFVVVSVNALTGAASSNFSL